jgi:hypothetical protein
MRWAMHPVTPITRRSGPPSRNCWSCPTRPSTRCSAWSRIAQVLTRMTSASSGRSVRLVPALRKDAVHQLGIADVHLAAVRLDVCLLHPSSPTVHSPLPAAGPDSGADGKRSGGTPMRGVRFRPRPQAAARAPRRAGSAAHLADLAAHAERTPIVAAGLHHLVDQAGDLRASPAVPRPRVVSAGVPMRTPEVTKGDSSRPARCSC